MTIDKRASSLTRQICNLFKEGLTPEQICEAFPDVELTPEAVEITIRSATNTKRISIDELIESKREAMVNVLESIALDDTKNESARVKAAMVLVERKGCLPLVEADEVSAMFRRMQELKLANDEKILVLPSATKSPLDTSVTDSKVSATN